jgi:hypothetical protein
MTGKTMRRAIILVENFLDSLTESRRVQNENGRFLLNPSPAEFSGYFRGNGAAFYVDTAGDVAFGAGAHGSTDHSSISGAFALGVEACRGFMDGASKVTVEAWAKHSADTIAPIDQRKIDACVQAARANRYLQRLASQWNLIVYNEDYVEIEDAPI